MRDSTYFISLLVLFAIGLLVSSFLIIDQFYKYQGRLQVEEEQMGRGSQRIMVPKERLYSNFEKKIDEGQLVRAISILGERNSGTTWMYEHLNHCFNHSVPINRRLTRYKHWFQDETVSTSKIQNETLVIAMFRNPYDWVEAMRKKPHHASEHLYLDWKEFVTKPWTMDRVGLDLIDLNQEEKRTQPCQEAFSYKDVVSCNTRPFPEGFFNITHYSNHQPFYEMRNDGTGKPYDNILQLRAAKNKNFVATKDFAFVKELWILRYEDMLRRGTGEVIKQIEKAIGTEARCKASPPQLNRKKRELIHEEMDYLKANVDWEAEMMIGYSMDGFMDSNSSIYSIHAS